MNPLYLADRKDEIGFARWTATLIDSILTRDNEHKQVQLGTTKMRIELIDVIEFESTPNKSRRANYKIERVQQS